MNLGELNSYPSVFVPQPRGTLTWTLTSNQWQEENSASPNSWKQNNMLLNNLWARKEVSREKQNIELNEKENTYQNLWDMAKLTFMTEIYGTTVYIREEENISNQ